MTIRLIKFTSSLFAALLLLIVAACGGGSETFRLNGHIEGFGTGNLRVVYFDRGAIQNVTATAVDGNFGVDARASSPVMIRLYTGNGRLLGAFNASPGDKIEASFNIADAADTQLTGNDDAERLSAFLKANAESFATGNRPALNKAIASYVSQNPNRNVSGTLMASYYYLPGYEAEASKLIEQLNEKVRRTASLQGLTDIARLSTKADSARIESFTAADTKGHSTTIAPTDAAFTLLLFTDASARKSDSIAALMQHFSKSDSPATRIVDISIDADTAAWLSSLREITETDSLSTTERSVLKGVKRLWAPSPYSIMGLDAIAVCRTPWFVVADSTSRVLYSGTSTSAARASLPQKQ